MKIAGIYEGMPVAVTVGPVTVGYYFEWDKYVNALPVEEQGYKYNFMIHQLRVMFPLYTGEKLSLGARI